MAVSHHDNFTINIAAGRHLGFAEYGNRHGRPVLYFHGGLSSRIDARVTHKACSATGIRLLAIDRPGIGLSTVAHNRRMVEWPTDVAHFLDAVGIRTADVIGWSAGGPYALACARLIPERIGTVITVGGMIPVNQPGRVRELGLAADRILFPLSRRSPKIAAMALRATQLAGRKLFYASMLRALTSPSDRALVASWPVKDATDFFFEALRTGPDGTVEDYAILGGDWGFRLEDISKTVHVVQGVEDRLLPRDHAMELARGLPNSQLHWVKSAGHYVFHGQPESVLALLR